MIDRRQVLALLAGVAAAPALAAAQGMSRMTAYAFSFAALKGGDIKLSDYAGKPILVVNTASQCGYTPQYAGLQELWKRYRERGLMIVGVPSNDFGGQEPGGVDRDRAHCASAATASPSRSPPRPRCAAPARIRSTNGRRPRSPLELPRWNFHKYLVGRDGHIAASFPTQVEPTDPRVIAAIDKELSRAA